MQAQTLNAKRPLRILLAEDDLGDANITLEVFKEAKTPLEITRVKDGEEAVAFLKHHNPYEKSPTPDLVLLDLNMPRLSGFDVLKAVKEDPKLESVPILVLTCSKSEEDIQRAYDSRANFYLVKPVELKGFFELLTYLEEVWFKSLQHSENAVTPKTASQSPIWF